LPESSVRISRRSAAKRANSINQQLKDELRLDHYEGRTWRGWNHHVTLTMLAFAFLVLEMRQGQKHFWTAYATPSGAA